ncbi:MAG: AMP-binding protein [Bacteroidales bacterium]|nr:AMP-binding protein [Bacteroidales bacterium]
MNGSIMTLPGLLEETSVKYGHRPAFAFVGEKGFTYSEFRIRVYALIAWLEKMGIKRGDRVAILSTNMPNWPLVYFAVTSMECIVVPILHDFSEEEIENVLLHSETETIFVSSTLEKKLKDNKAGLKNLIRIEDFTVIRSQNEPEAFSETSTPEEVYNSNPDDLAAIIYTSGTTGKSKGVMLTHMNVCSNAVAGKKIQEINENDRFLSVLPLSHTFENTIGMLIPVMSGSAVYYLTKPPTAPVLLPALKEIRPTLMLAVPLIIEKIYFSSVRPKLTGSAFLKTLYGIAPFRKVLHKAAGKKLMETFGGEVKFFGIGGAKLNFTVERFLKEGKFPYAIGYGLTETSPLLAGAGPTETVLESTGRAVVGTELKINDPDPKTGEGEIWAKGPNIMKGYYKEPGLTEEVLTPDGWFRTGDLGLFNKENKLFIKGRLKNVIIGASGENIYPEEIESMINNFKHVAESLVIQQKGKLVALVHINREELEAKYQDMRDEMNRIVEEKINEILEELQSQINMRISKFARIQKVVLQPDPFQKTATQKIKRYLYY